MASQLIYTKSRAVHGPLVQRIYRAIRPGYAVVAKTHLQAKLESKLVGLACHGMGKGDVEVNPQFLYLPDSSSWGTQHIFGSLRWTKPGGAISTDYIAHFLVLTEDEIRDIWQSSSRLTPAGLLLVLELSNFWVQSWQGPIQWLTDTCLPNWAEAEAALQAQYQPAWQHYTGHKHFAGLLKEPQYRDSCMLALPHGTPVTDMLRLLHEADYLRSDLGWSIPISTRSSEGVMELPHVQLLGYIGGRLQSQAALAGLPIIEVTEQLSDGMSTPNTQLTPTFSTNPTPDAMRAQYAGELSEPTHLFAKLLRGAGKIILLGIAAICVHYVWQNYQDWSDKVSGLLTQAEQKGPDEQNLGKKESMLNSDDELNTDEKKLAYNQVVPVLAGQEIPNCIKRFFIKYEYRINTGKVATYHLQSANVASFSRELDGTACYAVISPGKDAGKWELKIFEGNSIIPGSTIVISVKGDTLHSITDEFGESVALLLPVTKNEKTIGNALLLPELRIGLPKMSSKSKQIEEKADRITEIKPEYLTSTPHKLALNSAPQTNHWEQQMEGQLTYTAADLFNLPAVARRNKILLEEDAANVCQLPPHGIRRGELLCYSPELMISFDLKQQVISHFLHFANTLHSSSTQKKRNPHSIAGAYFIVARVLTAPNDHKYKAVLQYAQLFADNDFMAFCEKELGYMMIPYRGGVTGQGTRIHVAPKVMERLMIVNFADIRRSLCERLTQEARDEFLRLLRQRSDAAVLDKRMYLREVRITAPGELTWIFGMRNAE